jgi:cytochrome c nitrite reductase small subunit
MVKVTSTPGFCKSCHVMETEYEDWFKSGLHRSIKCVDCHLPNSNPFSHLMWKAIDGSKDVISFYGHLYSDHISISTHGRKTIQSNCIRCHSETVSRITLEERRHCWSCHRRANHTFPQSGINSL